jgi:predicted nucleic acid-binding protein
MRAFLDTTVLVATFYGDHQHHTRSIDLFRQQKKSTACTASHCLAEVYAVATGMPGKNRADPDEVMLFLRDIQQRLTTIVLDQNDYADLLDEAATAGISGGAIYDAIIARCAIKAKAQTIYTWNVRHFARLSAVASRVREP